MRKAFGLQYLYESEEILGRSGEAARRAGRTGGKTAWRRLGRDRVRHSASVEFEAYDAFIPAKLLNSARRQIAQALCEAKLGEMEKPDEDRGASERRPVTLPSHREPYLTATVTTHGTVRRVQGRAA